MTDFCPQVWEKIQPLLKATLDHPFNRELSAGTLSADIFRFYLIQDARYLADFSRALAHAAAIAPDPDDAAFLAGSSANVITVERGLHERYLARYEGVDNVPTSPSATAYNNHLLAAAQRGGFGLMMATVLPCFWIYEYVGRAIHAEQSGAPNPYGEWIQTYADDGFSQSVARAKDIADRAAASASAYERAAMVEAFVRSAEYEWMFWDSAYRQEVWPTAGFAIQE
ncbi:thiaminase II [Fodinicola feengrottensis]|uniref:Thiaminase II n=1 Tax=Fodinicola feengrottensis TaxID=435914 RepID=A0ABN2I751_9ACTN